MAWSESHAHGGAGTLAMPKWTLIVRFFQLVLAFIMLVLTAYSASKLGSGAAGFGLTWFTFIFTVLYFVYLGVSLSSARSAYHSAVHLILEILVNIFWLSSWAVLASEASDISTVEHYYNGYIDLLPSGYRSALNCVKAAAALGAILWVLFCITLAFMVITFAGYSRTSTTGGVGNGVESKPTEMHNYNHNGVGGAGVGAAPPGGVPADTANGYSAQQPSHAAETYTPGMQQHEQQAGYANPSAQQYQEQPVTGAVPPQNSTV
ncbi:hypothetical protein SEPCBS119000_004478 [Sporothrix epigloea]|uniref:MARVEL domain-containing protein n=1 Tax=Sporothrix epigloea TaxID=1892477 RepID=A0ABP0DU56_9PEZI